MAIHLEGYGVMKWSSQLYLFIKVPIPTSLFTICSEFSGGNHLQ